MGHILYLEIFSSFFLDFYGTRPSATAKERLTGWIGDGNTVDNQIIIMESRNLRIAGYSPKAIIAFLHVVLSAAEVYLYVLCLRSHDTEHYAIVFQYSRIPIAVNVCYRRVRPFREDLSLESLC